MKSRVGRALILVLVLAAGLRGWAVHEYTQTHPLSDAPTIDEASYDAWAVDIASGDWMGEEVFFQEPLYPYFLGSVYAVFGRSLLGVRLIQVLLGVLTCWLVAQLGRRLAGDWAGVIAALLFACLPSAILLPCLLLKPNLHLPLFCTTALLLTRPGPGGIRRWLAIGITGALAALLRGNSLVLLAAFFVWSVLPRPRSRPSFVRCGSLLLGLMFVLGPVALRNQHVGGVWALTTSGAGTNLYGGNNIKHNPMGVATELPWVRGVPEHEAGDWRREAERRTGEEFDPGEVSRYWLAETARSVGRDPIAHAGIFWNKLRATLGFYAVPDNHLLHWDAQYMTALRLPLPGFGVLATLGLAGCLVGLFMRRRHETPFNSEQAGLRTVMLLGLYLATIVLTVTSMRARMPLTVLLAPLAGAWVLSVYSGPRIKPILLACATGAFVAWPVFSAEERTQDIAERDYNLVVQQLKAGSRTEETRALVEKLVAAHPNTSRFRILSAELGFADALELRDEGEEPSAIMKEEAALEVLHGLTSLETLSSRNLMLAHRLAGHIHSIRGDWIPAEESFRSAREFDSEGKELRAAHARALVRRVEKESGGAVRTRLAEEARALLDGLDDEDMPAANRVNLLGRLADMSF